MNEVEPFKYIGGVRYPNGGFMHLHNPRSRSETYNFNFEIPDAPAGAAEPRITRDAEVQLFFDSASFSILEAQGAFSQPSVQVRDGHQVILKESLVSFKNITLPEKESLTLYVGFSFLTDSITSGVSYRYNVWQALSDNPEERLGTENFLIRKSNRLPFNADAGPDKVVPLGQSVTLQATQLPEIAEYNWYTEGGIRVHSGPSFTTSPTASQTYRLEVILMVDGYKDYDDAAVQILNGDIESISPNPTTGTATI